MPGLLEKREAGRKRPSAGTVAEDWAETERGNNRKTHPNPPQGRALLDSNNVYKAFLHRRVLGFPRCGDLDMLVFMIFLFILLVFK